MIGKILAIVTMVFTSVFCFALADAINSILKMDEKSIYELSDKEFYDELTDNNLWLYDRRKGEKTD